MWGALGAVHLICWFAALIWSGYSVVVAEDHGDQVMTAWTPAVLSGATILLVLLAATCGTSPANDFQGGLSALAIGTGFGAAFMSWLLYGQLDQLRHEQRVIAGNLTLTEHEQVTSDELYRAGMQQYGSLGGFLLLLRFGMIVTAEAVASERAAREARRASYGY